ncbi:methyl-CpG-binding domain-containing protein 4-like isoform X1 [Pyrus communis]|uniref:methyl-CpG-binding domain-containing protein 4-like isoform X1 n=1 Tax=Pyrus communis TaxID=23211 RepID=UPI0035C1262C
MDGQSPKTSSSKKPNIAKSSIDVYAAQCEECKKWRVIHSEEEYEEIRSKISTEPFYCNKKSGVTCDDAADIEYSASRTWVIDKPDLPKTPEGFKRHLVARKDYSKLDTYYITPNGKRLRSKNEMAAFLRQNRMDEGISASDFDFAPPKVMEDTVPEIFSKKGSDSVRKKLKMRKNEDKSTDITAEEDFE